MNIAIRVDASIYIGSGHVMRCLVLAEALAKQGHQLTFFCRPQQGDLIDFILNKGFAVTRLNQATTEKIPQHSADYQAWLQVPWQQDADDVIAQCDTIDLMIVDHYGINAPWEDHVKTQLSCLVFVIDDLVRTHNADAILDQTLHRQAQAYQSCHHNTPLLMGGDYALLNPVFLHARKKALQAAASPLPSPINLLITMGAVDQPNATLHVLNALAKITHERPIVTVLLNHSAPHYQCVVDFCQQHRDWVSHHPFVENMAELMLTQHLVIGAPGTTAWERACLGLPSIIVPIAENQLTMSTQLAKAGAAISVELSAISSTLLTAYYSLLEHWQSMRTINFALCDGLGVRRVAHYIEQLLMRSSPQVLLRNATVADIKQVYDWQLQPSTRQYALTPSVPTWSAHQTWMKTQLSTLSNPFYIITLAETGEAIGVVRLAAQNAVYLISIYLGHQHIGKGYAKAALACIDALHPTWTIKATVLVENTASHALFSAANYHQTRSDTFIRFPLSQRLV